jgi:hypothetical protein
MTPAEALRIFELDDRCTPEQVRAAYRELVKVWHPDRFANDTNLRAKADRRLQEINSAYAVLQDRAETVDPPRREATPRSEAQDRAETVETPREATPPPHVATPPPGAQSRPARWSVAPLVIIGLLTGAFLVGIVMMLVRPPQEAPAPVSGTDLLAGPVAGGGSLIVLNADRRDVVLVFVDAGVQTRALYIRAGERLQMLDVAPGAYRIWVAAGRGWSRDHFATDQMFQEIEKPLTIVNDDSAPQTITIAAPGTGTSTRLRARSPFVLKLQR